MRPPLISRAALLIAFIAALRLAWLERRMPLDALVARLRQGRPLPPHLADPRLYSKVVGRWQRVLPPYRRMGRCMKRSLLLLHLWSRCGLEPTFHYGIGRDSEGRRRAHAWLGNLPEELAPVTSGVGFTEALVL